MAKSSASTVWKGFLSFGLISIPIRLTPAARSTRISFHLLHDEDHSRIHEQMVCTKENVVVDRKSLVKGYELDNGRYVVVEDSDLEKIEPPSSRTMEVLECVRLEEVDPIYFDMSYFVLAEEAGQKAYSLLTQALSDAGYVAVARLTMHQRENVVFIRPGLGGLILHTLFYENEVRSVTGFGAEHSRVSTKELDMAKTFVEALATSFKPEKFHDTYQAQVEKLIEAKVKGHKFKAVEQPAVPPPAADLMAALKASLAKVSPRKKR